MKNRKKIKEIKNRNPYAKALARARFRKRVVPVKKRKLEDKEKSREMRDYLLMVGE